MSTHPTLSAPARTIGDSIVGAGRPVYITGEIGINHNGELSNAFALIDQAAAAGCDAVKFQKRTPEVCTPRDQWEIERDTPWGRMTYIDYRHRVEFGVEEYAAIDEHARQRGIAWFASPWDVESVDFLEQFDVPAHKVASASLTDDELLRRLRATGRTDHPVHRDVHPAADPARRRGAGQRHHRALPRHQHLPGQAVGAEPADDPHPAGRVPERADRLLRSRGRPADHPGGGRPRRHLRRAAHHPRPGHVGLRPGRLGRAARSAAPGPRHPHHQRVPRRRREEDLRR